MIRMMTGLRWGVAGIAVVLLTVGCLTISVDKPGCCAGDDPAVNGSGGDNGDKRDDLTGASGPDSTGDPPGDSPVGPPKKKIFIYPDPISGDVHFKIDGVVAQPVSTSDTDEDLNDLFFSEIHDFEIDITSGSVTKTGQVDYLRVSFDNPAFPGNDDKRRVLIVNRVDDPDRFHYTLKLADGSNQRTLEPKTRSPIQQLREDLCQKMTFEEVTYSDPWDGDEWKTGTLPASASIRIRTKE